MQLAALKFTILLMYLSVIIISQEFYGVTRIKGENKNKIKMVCNQKVYNGMHPIRTIII